MTALEEIELTILKLPLPERLSLLESLLASIPEEADDLSEEAQIQEAERRANELETGQVQGIEEAEFFRRVEARSRE